MNIKQDLLNLTDQKRIKTILLMLIVGIMMNTKIYAQPLMIAHAGGGIDGKRYTNSLEALDYSYASGFRYFEIDFSWTNDHKLVCLHDWGKSFKKNFGFKTKQALSFQKFKKLVSIQKKRHPCTLKSLFEWLKLHPDSIIITDVKYNNLEAMKLMLREFPELSKNLIPQFYQPSEYKILKDMGFKQLIWILYQYKGRKSNIIEYANRMELLAISMRSSQAKKAWAQNLIKNNHTIFVYTVNKSKTVNKMFNIYGIKGFYTDFLSANN